MPDRGARLEGLHVEGMRRAAHQPALRVHVDDHRGDLQQRVGGGDEAAGLDVDDDGQEAAKAAPERRGFPLGAVHGASRQPRVSPARSGTSSSSPKG